MKWISTLSEHARLESALTEAAGAATHALGRTPDLAFVFPSQHFAAEYERVPELVSRHFAGGVLLGCSAGAVIGKGQEVEERPAVSVIAAILPDVDIHPFHIEQDDLPDADSSPRAWHDMIGVDASETRHFVLLVDPFSIQIDHCLTGLDYAYPESKKIGGMASGAARPGANALYLGNRFWGVGMVGVAISGDIDVDTVVAQGCRPVGAPKRVTACKKNIMLRLDDKAPLQVVREMYESLSESDQELARSSLHLGVLTDELAESFGAGDFLIRNIVGIDPNSGVIAVSERLREGQTVQFHLRDSQTSSDDLDHLLARCKQRALGTEEGALLFSCLGRGQNLYGRPDHDTDMFRKRFGPLPIGGFFAAGEIGPVGHSTFVHGFTSSFGIFRPKPSDDETAAPPPDTPPASGTPETPDSSGGTETPDPPPGSEAPGAPGSAPPDAPGSTETPSPPPPDAS